MAKFKKKTRVRTIDAIQWTGSNLDAVREFMSPKGTAWQPEPGSDSVAIGNVEHVIVIKAGEWIVIDAGSSILWQMKPDEFEKMYEGIE